MIYWYTSTSIDYRTSRATWYEYYPGIYMIIIIISVTLVLLKELVIGGGGDQVARSTRGRCPYP